MGVMPGQGNPESLASDMKFEFTKMQNDLFDSIKKTHFMYDRQFI